MQRGGLSHKFCLSILLTDKLGAGAIAPRSRPHHNHFLVQILYGATSVPVIFLKSATT